VLSGNRNFEGRVHPLTRANYLASPPLVVAYALAGTVCLLLERACYVVKGVLVNLISESSWREERKLIVKGD